MAADDAMT